MAYKNKKDQARCSRKYYLANKEKIKQSARLSNKRRMERNREFVNNYLKNHPCVDCGENNIIVLEFDHIRGQKINAIANMKGSYYSISTIKREIEKCEVRCANCHRIKTFERRKNREHKVEG